MDHADRRKERIPVVEDKRKTPFQYFFDRGQGVVSGMTQPEKGLARLTYQVKRVADGIAFFKWAFIIAAILWVVLGKR